MLGIAPTALSSTDAAEIHWLGTPMGVQNPMLLPSNTNEIE